MRDHRILLYINSTEATIGFSSEFNVKADRNVICDKFRRGRPAFSLA